MTLRESYEYVLIECNKLKAPSILLEDFVYTFNKAIQQYINSVYNRCEFDQQSTDDLGWLQTRKQITEIIENNRCNLPNDYVHLLNCIVTFSKNSSCANKNTITSPCRRMTADLYGGVMNNYYLKPTPKRPYYYIINDYSVQTQPTKDNSKIKFEFGEDWEKSRNSHQTPVKLEILGATQTWNISNVEVTYLRSPMYYTMTQEDIFNMDDETQILEFPDYVCYEIINICVRLLLENASDPRLQTHIPVNQTIVSADNK